MALESGAEFCPRCGSARGQRRPADTMVGRTVIGQYVIRQRLGEGGMGAVYLADQPSVGRQAVVKVMHPSLSADPSVAPRFEVEARAASQLNHPHIITIYNYGAMEDGTLFLAMEYVKGPSLEDLVSQEPMSPGRVAAVGAQICDALAEAHRHGVVHRDLKPSNIMLAHIGRQHDFVKVLDFGIAKVEGVKMTRTGSVIGTPQYMSPEQLRGEELDGRSDLYALGGILYQMVSGQLPFKADTAAGFMHKHLNESPVPPTLCNPDVQVPPALEAVILRALAKAPAERFLDAESMGRALELCRDGAVIPLTAQSAAAPPVAPGRRRLGLWIALASSLVVVTGGTATWAVLHLGGRERPPRAAAAPAAAPARVAWRSLSGPREALQDSVQVKETVADGGTVGQVPPPLARKARKPRRVASRSVPPRAELEPEPPTEASRRVTLTMNRESKVQVAPSRPRAAPSTTTMSADQLERELRRVMSTARVPPSVVDKTLESYSQTQQSWPADRREELRHRYLSQLLVTYRKSTLQLAPFERRPLSQLRQVFLTMQTKANLSVERREQILDQALATYDQGSFPAKDRPFYKRIALVGMIKAMAADPAAAMR